MESAGNRAWVLLGVGVLSALAALFGPSESLAGVDLGATGATLFMLTLGAAIWLFAARGEAVFPDYMSVAERRAWVSLVFLGVMIAAFAKEMWTLSAHAIVPDGISDLFARRFIERYVALVIAWSLIAYLIGRRDGGVEADERDLRLRHRADRAGDLALTLIVIGGIAVLASTPAPSLAWWLQPIVLANVLIGLLMAKILVEQLMLAYSYRFQSGGA